MKHKVESITPSLIVLLVAFATGCDRHLADSREKKDNQPAIADPCRLVLTPSDGATDLDKKVAAVQQRVRVSNASSNALEQLGWLFVAKARVSFDPGFYKLAEQCALCMEARSGRSPEALLLRGHVLQNLHKFKEAEPVAQELVARRGLPFDFGLLGDVFMEQGRLDEALVAYQRMLDLRPDLHSYSRGAHVRWLKGDVEGAAELMSLAASAATPLDTESAAWVNTRLAGYQFQLGLAAEAERSCAAALGFQSNYPPGLLLRGRMLLADGKPECAVEALRLAAKMNPLPEYQWTLAEALRATGREDQAASVETQLRRHGATTDPRTFALFLATRGAASQAAVRLAKAELNSRQDVFTHDALAWTLAAAGEWNEATVHVSQALAEGTQDARLFLHAGIIYAKSGRIVEADRKLNLARGISHLLLPSEKSLLTQSLSSLQRMSTEPKNVNQKTKGKELVQHD